MKTTLLSLILFLNLTSFAKSKSPYIESELVLKTKTGDIFGTLTIPSKNTNNSIAIIVAGSGPTDRNGNNPLGVNSDTYKMIAEQLSLKGISCLRYDKRGIAKSKEAAKTIEGDMTLDKYVDDLVDWVNFIKTDTRFSKITIIGHSEGSLIGMLAAQKSQVNKYISIAGPGRTLDVLLKEQLGKQLLPQEMKDQTSVVLDSLKNGHKVTNYPILLGSLFNPSIQPYIISMLKYDPAVEIGKVKVPVLIIQGTTDMQVLIADSDILHKGNPSAEYKLFENMNHVLKNVDSDIEKNKASYTNPKLPLKKGLMKEINTFILK